MNQLENFIVDAVLACLKLDGYEPTEGVCRSGDTVRVRFYQYGEPTAVWMVLIPGNGRDIISDWSESGRFADIIEGFLDILDSIP